MTREDMLRITWLGMTRQLKKANIPPQATLHINDRVAMCPLLGVGMSRCVYALGKHYVYKYEYANEKPYSNNKELLFSEEYPEMRPMGASAPVRS